MIEESALVNFDNLDDQYSFGGQRLQLEGAIKTCFWEEDLFAANPTWNPKKARMPALNTLPGPDLGLVSTIIFLLFPSYILNFFLGQSIPWIIHWIQ